MTKHKNAILLIIALILFAYAGIVGLVAPILNSTFNISEFEKKVEKETGLVTKVEKVMYQVKPNLNLMIYVFGWSSKYIDNQDCFDANYIEIETDLPSLITKNFVIKNMELKNISFSNQLLPEGVNKLAYLPKNFTAKSFGHQKVTLTTGPVTVKGFKKTDIAPGYYKETFRDEVKYSKSDVRIFLQKLQFANVTIK